MFTFRFVFFIVALFWGATVMANMYSWTDDRGVLHFSDTAPSTQVTTKFKIKEEKLSVTGFDHYLYRINDGYGYCGSRRLPSQKELDKRKKTIALLSSYKSTRSLRQQLKQDMDALPKRLNKGETEQFISRKQESLEKRIHECDCLLMWMKVELEGLELVIDLIIQEAHAAEYEYNEILARCGPEPILGVQTNKEAAKWVECERKMMNLRNKQLKRLKSKRGMAESLKRAMEEN